MAKSLKFEGVTRGNNCFVIKHSEGEEIVFARDDADFADWCKSRAPENAQAAIGQFAAWVAATDGAGVAAFDKHKGKTITLDATGGDIKSAKSQLRVG